MMSGYESYAATLTITVMLAAGFSLPASAQPDPVGACCHEGDLPTENVLKGGSLVAFCEELSEVGCLEPHINPVWHGAGTTCGGPGPFNSLIECADAVIDLPVELTHFDALVDNGSVVLVWATASETNNAGFSVEHEVGSAVFAEIGYVVGQGTAREAKEYSFTVDNVDPGAHRFRLKQIDFDGAFSYSAVVEAAVTVPDRFLIEPAYPNPFNPSTTLRFAVAVEQHVEITLLNAAGQSIRTLYSGTVAANEMQPLIVDADALPSGTYMVHFTGSKGVSATERIVLAK